MSGSGSRWKPTAPSNSCERLNFLADLNSPQPNAIGSLKIGDMLEIKLQTIPTASLVAEKAGVIFGAITGTKANELINCIQNGYTYQAEVISVVGGKCTIRVSHI